MPASANTRIASTGPSSQCSGLIEHWKFERNGPSANASAPPATRGHLQDPCAFKP